MRISDWSSDVCSSDLCASFGNAGFVDLKNGMGIVEKGFYSVSSAPTIVRGRIVLGGWVSDNQSTDEPSGVIRAYDAASGRSDERRVGNACVSTCRSRGSQ